MKTSIQVYKPPDSDKGPKCPASFQVMQSTFIQGMVWTMRLFGLSRVSVRPAMITLLTVPDITFKTLIENPPPEFMACRNFVARTVGQTMLLFGIMDIEIVPDEKELRVLRQEWSALVRGIQPGGVNKKEIKLNLESDPTGESVLDATPVTDAIGQQPAAITVETPAAPEQPQA